MATEIEIYHVADGILDESNDHRNDLIEMSPAERIREVQGYAEAGSIVLDDEEAELVATHVVAMLIRLNGGEIPGSDDWWHYFEKPLREAAKDGKDAGAYAHTANGEPIEIFARLNEDGSYSVLHVEDGQAVSRLDGCWPLDSDLAGSYEHPEGIRLDAEQVRTLGIEIED